MPKFRVVLPPISAPGGDQKGAIVELTDDQAQPLINLGVIKSVASGEIPQIETPDPEGDELGGESGGEQPLVDSLDIDRADGEAELDSDGGEGGDEPPALLNLNTATEAEILAVKHIGKAAFTKLDKARKTQPLTTLEQARQVAGITEANWAEIAPGLTV